MDNLKYIALKFKEHGIESYYVGGCVRDEIMGLPVDDTDICLVGGTEDMVNAIFTHLLDNVNPVESVAREVGAKFPVWIVTVAGEKIDYAMARTEKLIGNTRTDFDVLTEGVTIEEDLGRRDLTINSIAKNVITGLIIDPYLGIVDIEAKIAREVSMAFAEDSLRVIRAARFIARFYLTPSESLVCLCESLKPDDISNERVGMELMKLFKQVRKCSLFFTFLRRVGWLKYYFKEVHDLIGIPQSEKYHPEGDAYTHTLHCIDAADDWFTKVVMLCHDLGKVSTTTIEDNGDIHAIGHEEAGVPLTKAMLKRIHFASHDTIHQISILVKLHMINVVINENNAQKMVRRTLRELINNDLTYQQLVSVVRCDLSGRPPLYPPDINKELIYEKYAQDVFHSGQMEQVVTGKLLIEEGLTPSPEFGKITARALELQDRGTLNKHNWKERLLQSGVLSPENTLIIKNKITL